MEVAFEPPPLCLITRQQARTRLFLLHKRGIPSLRECLQMLFQERCRHRRHPQRGHKHNHKRRKHTFFISVIVLVINKKIFRNFLVFAGFVPHGSQYVQAQSGSCRQSLPAGKDGFRRCYRDGNPSSLSGCSSPAVGSIRRIRHRDAWSPRC